MNPPQFHLLQLQPIETTSNGLVARLQNEAAQQIDEMERLIAHAAVKSASAMKCARHDTLSRQEARVMVGIVEGKTAKQIAKDMGIAERTTACYLQRIREKLGLGAEHMPGGTRAEVVRYAFKVAIQRMRIVVDS